MKHCLVLLIVGALLASGCANNPIAGAAAMRIDVDVYKGPLSQEPETQWGGLIGYLEEARRSILENTNFILSVVQSRGFLDARKDEKTGAYFTHTPLSKLLEVHSEPDASRKEEQDYFIYRPIGDTHDQRGTPVTWCDKLDPAGVFDQLRYLDCLTLRTLYVDSLDTLEEIEEMIHDYVRPLHPKNQPGIEWIPEKPIPMLTEVAELSNEFRAKAYRWSVGNTAGQSMQPDIRICVVGFVMILSEFGNQLQARADALLKQHETRDPKRDAHELPLSTYLRESGPTEFLHLYNWLDASDDLGIYNFIKGLYPGAPSMGVEDRIKVIQRLYSDHFWSRINSVHASGRGRVNMVFVKDEIGNWNLKNFENLPGELLDAYVKVSKTLLETAASLAGDVATGGNTSGVKLLLQTAKETVGPKNGSTVSVAHAQMQSSEAELASGLQSIKARLAKEPAPAGLTPQAALAEAAQLINTFQEKVELMQKTHAAFQASQNTGPRVLEAVGGKLK